MKSEKNKQSSPPLILWLMVVVWIALLTGCTTTVAVKPVKQSAASWDGTNFNSGVVRFIGDSIEYTPHARDRYNALIVIYGKQFTPAITNDYGVTPTATGTFIFTPEAVENFSSMRRWHAAKPP